MLIILLNFAFCAVEDFIYTDPENTTIKKCISQESFVEIPNQVTEILSFAFSSSPTKEVNFQEGSLIQKINSFAFQSLSLENVTFPPVLDSFSKSVFSGSTSLKNVVIQSKISFIPDFLFSFCFQLQSLVINESNVLSDSVLDFTNSSVTSIGISSFNHVSLTKIIIPSSFNKFQPRLFKNYQNIQELIINANLTQIPDEFFSNSSSLNSIIIGDKIILNDGNLTLDEFDNIGVNSFYKTSIKSIFISSSVINFDSRAFVGCNNLLSINIEKNYSDLSIFNFGELINLQEVNIGGFQIILNQSLDLSQSPFTVIPDYSFSNSSLVEAIIPSSVESIGKHAFSFCKNLKNLFIEFELKDVPEGLLYFSTLVESITIGNQQILKENELNLTIFENIGSNAFYGISSITKIILSKNNHFFNVRAIGGTSVESVHFGSIPESFSSSYGFYRSPVLNCVTLSDSCENYSHLNFHDIFAETPLNFSDWCDSLCPLPSFTEPLTFDSFTSELSSEYSLNLSEVPTLSSGLSSSEPTVTSSSSEPTVTSSSSEPTVTSSSSEPTVTSLSEPIVTSSSSEPTVTSSSESTATLSSKSNETSSPSYDYKAADLVLDIVLLVFLGISLLVIVLALVKCLKSSKKESTRSRSEMNSSLL